MFIHCFIEPFRTERDRQAYRDCISTIAWFYGGISIASVISQWMYSIYSQDKDMGWQLFLVPLLVTAVVILVVHDSLMTFCYKRFIRLMAHCYSNRPKDYVIFLGVLTGVLSVAIYYTIKLYSTWRLPQWLTVWDGLGLFMSLWDFLCICVFSSRCAQCH